MRIGVITATEPFGQGLHRILARGLATTLAGMGHSVECVMLPFTGRCDVLDQAWAFRTLHVAETFDRIVTLRPPAHLIVHPRKVAWLSDHPGYGDGTAGAAVERRLAAADRTALLAAERVYTTSVAAGARWLERTGVPGALLQPPSPPALGCVNAELPDSVTAVHLGPDGRGGRLPALVEALRFTSPAVRVRLCGGISDPVLLEQLQLIAARLRPGRLTIDGHRPAANAMPGLLSAGRALICLASDDDTVLAVLSRAAAEARPVIVSRDCAAAVQWVEGDQAGIAVDAEDPHAIAGALDSIAAAPAWAAAMGRAAHDASVARPGWESVAQALLNE